MRQVTPEEASAETDAFVVELADDPFCIERLFCSIETRAAPVIERVRHRLNLDETQRETLAQFAALFFIRSSRRVADAQKVESTTTIAGIERYLRHSSTKVRIMLEHPRLQASQYDASVDRYLKELRNGLKALPRVPDPAGLALIPSALTKWADRLCAMNWVFETATQGDFFVVGDEPLVARRPHHLFDPGYVGIGRDDLGVEVTFPINRTTCLVASGAAAALSYRPIESSRVSELNLRSVVGAHKMFFSPYQSSHCDDYIAEVGTRTIEVAFPPDIADLLLEA